MESERWHRIVSRSRNRPGRITSPAVANAKRLDCGAVPAPLLIPASTPCQSGDRSPHSKRCRGRCAHPGSWSVAVHRGRRPRPNPMIPRDYSEGIPLNSPPGPLRMDLGNVALGPDQAGQWVTLSCLRYEGETAESWRCSAGCQPAVSQVANLRRCVVGVGRLAVGGTADRAVCGTKVRRSR